MIHKFISSVLSVYLLMISQTVLCQNNKTPDIENILALQNYVIPIAANSNYQALIEQSNSSDIVLIGDASHGTHEFYQHRINLSKQLIKDQNFKLVTIEANWPDTYILNQYIHSQISLSQLKTINPFKQYPQWMWKNQETFEFLNWLRNYNKNLPKDQLKVNLFGIDLYSYHSSIKWVIDYFSMFYPPMANYIKSTYDCLLSYQEPGDYGVALANKKHTSCEQASEKAYAIFLNCKMIACRNFNSYFQQEAFFHAQQQAFIVKNNEQYYRSIYTSENPSESWNIRDQYMFDALLTIRTYLTNPKTIVWAHVSHLGDARATSMSEYNQLNVGQLLRQHFKDRLFSIGLFTYKGEVIASNEWGQPMLKKKLLEADSNSYEWLFHQLNIADFILLLKQLPSKLRAYVNEQRLQRHVGVVYMPENEIDFHYSDSQLVDQFDAIMYFDTTTALHWENRF